MERLQDFARETDSDTPWMFLGGSSIISSSDVKGLALLMPLSLKKWLSIKRTECQTNFIAIDRHPNGEDS